MKHSHWIVKQICMFKICVKNRLPSQVIMLRFTVSQLSFGAFVLNLLLNHMWKLCCNAINYLCHLITKFSFFMSFMAWVMSHLTFVPMPHVVGAGWISGSCWAKNVARRSFWLNATALWIRWKTIWENTGIKMKLKGWNHSSRIKTASIHQKRIRRKPIFKAICMPRVILG